MEADAVVGKGLVEVWAIAAAALAARISTKNVRFILRSDSTVIDYKSLGSLIFRQW